MKVSRGGGHEQGMLMLLRPLQLPVPSGSWPAVTPKSGTSAGSTPPLLAALLDAAAAVVVVAAAVELTAATDTEDDDAAEDDAAASIAAACAPNVVAACGQPLPGPLRFWSVTVAAVRRASWDAGEPSSGKEMPTEGLLSTCPAATFAFSSCRREGGEWLARHQGEEGGVPACVAGGVLLALGGHGLDGEFVDMVLGHGVWERDG